MSWLSQLFFFGLNLRVVSLRIEYSFQFGHYIMNPKFQIFLFLLNFKNHR